MEHAGVPISIISKWAGHYDSAFTQKTYVHASEEDLQRARPRSPRFTRSLRAVRNCETTGPKTRIRTLMISGSKVLTCGYVARSEGLEPPTF
jgi:hypothetical protein